MSVSRETLAMTRDAWISPCGRYRYRLRRRWSEGSLCLWVMLNPSTADAHVDDPTIRRCIGFSQAWGHGGLEVVNVYAFRATKPRDLFAAEDPFGPENAKAIDQALQFTSRTIVAWGANAREHEAIHTYWQLIAYRPVYCLGKTRSGHPRHPLYIRGSTPPSLYLVAGSEQ